jgi:hypothetical protein
MMRISSLAVTLVAAATLAAGCGQPGSGGQAGGGTHDRGFHPPARHGCVTPKLAPSQALTITNRDNGKSYCITSGMGVFIVLHGTPSRMWAPIRSSSAVLQPRPNGRLALVRGVTGAYFVATRFGTVRLTSSRVPCRPGGVRCNAQSFFRVNLLVHGRA